MKQIEKRPHRAHRVAFTTTTHNLSHPTLYPSHHSHTSFTTPLTTLHHTTPHHTKPSTSSTTPHTTLHHTTPHHTIRYTTAADSTPHHTTLYTTAADQTPLPHTTTADQTPHHHQGTLYTVPLTRGGPHAKRPRTTSMRTIRQQASDTRSTECSWSTPPKPLPSTRILAPRISSSGTKIATLYRTYITSPPPIPHPLSTSPTTRSSTPTP